MYICISELFAISLDLLELYAYKQMYNNYKGNRTCVDIINSTYIVITLYQLFFIAAKTENASVESDEKEIAASCTVLM